MKNLPVRQNTQVALRKAKNLMGITDRILAERKTGLSTSDDGWVQRLWDWADRNNIPDLTWMEDVNHKDGGGAFIGIPRDIETLFSFEMLNIVTQYIEEPQVEMIPTEICNLTGLKKVSFFGNRLCALPSGFSNLKKVEALNLGNNQFDKFPLEILELEKLTYLDLSDNCLLFSEEIGSLAGLETLIFFSQHT